MTPERLEISTSWFRILLGLLLFIVGLVQIVNWMADPASTWFAAIPYIPQPLLAFGCVLLAIPISLVGSGRITSEDERRKKVKRYCQIFAVLCALSLYRFIAAIIDLFVEGPLPQHRQSFGIWLFSSILLGFLYGKCVLQDVEEKDKTIRITSDDLKAGTSIWYFHASVKVFYWNTPSAAKLVQSMADEIFYAGYGAAAGALKKLSEADMPNFLRFYEMQSQMQNIVKPELDSEKLAAFLTTVEEKKETIRRKVSKELADACLAEAVKRFGPRKAKLRRAAADTVETQSIFAQLVRALRLPAGRPCEINEYLSIEYSDKLESIMDMAQKIKTDALIAQGAEGAKVRVENLLRYTKGYINTQDAIHTEQSLHELADAAARRDGDNVPPLIGAQRRRDSPPELKAEGEARPKSISSGTDAKTDLAHLTEAELARKLIKAVGRDRALQEAQLSDDICSFFTAAGASRSEADLLAAFLIAWGQASGHNKLNEQAIIGGCEQVPRFVAWVKQQGFDNVRQELINDYIQQTR